jgi:transporter family protein
MLGVLLALCAAASWGTDAVLARQGLRRMPPAFGTLVSLCASVVGAVVVALIFDREHLRSYPPNAFAWFALIGLVNFLGGRQCNYEAVKRLGAARATPIFAASPLVSIALAVALTGERLTLPLLLGAVLIVIGVVLVVSS